MEPELERRIVERLKAGDPSAFEVVYAAYRSRVFSFLARLCRRRDVAEDLAHETWLRFVAHAHRLDQDTSIPAWLFTVARNLHASWCRHRALDGSRVADAPASWPQPAAGWSPFEAVAGHEMEQRLERALARLTIADRELVLMVSVGGLTPAEAARAIGLAPDALRKRLQRARERLAAELDTEAAFGRVQAG